MNGRYRILLFLLTVLLIWKSFQYFPVFSNDENGDVEDPKLTEKVKVTVYYEALCPDSKFFVTHQLLNAYEIIPEHLSVELIPYGKAQTVEVEGKTVFYCQHDVVECFANKIHACAIDLIDDPMLLLKYIACMITDNVIPDDAGEKCGQEFNIDYTPIGECAKGDRGTELLKMYGVKTHSLNPSVKFIPTIELNGSQSVVPQSAILKDLLQAVCQIYKRKPKKCGW